MDYLGDRIKNIRTSIYNCTQTELAELINLYYKQNKNKKKFTQTNFSTAENQQKIQTKKLIDLLNFFYDTKRINPTWMLIENNKSLPKLITKIVINKDLVDLHEMLEKNAQNMLKNVNDIRIIIDNTVNK